MIGIVEDDHLAGKSGRRIPRPPCIAARAPGQGDCMTAIRILHVDDEPDIREVVGISLGIDPGLVTRSCDSGQDALAVAADWQPDAILLDVMMPLMDGPATLIGLRQNPKTMGIPVIFMTARAEPRELDRFRALGAVGMIAKPFDPMALAASVRSYVPSMEDPLEEQRAGFLRRLKKDAAALSALRCARMDGPDSAGSLAAIRLIAHGLAGAAGIFGFAEISDAAALLEDEAIAETASPGLSASLDEALDHLICRAENDNAPRTEHVALSSNA
jgi:two-component system OmpR family response regulator